MELSEAVAIARQLPSAADGAAERQVVATLRDALTQVDGGSIRVDVDVAGKGTVNLQSYVGGDAQAVRVILSDKTGGDQVVGPYKPKDINVYFDLFLE